MILCINQDTRKFNIPKILFLLHLPYSNFYQISFSSNIHIIQVRKVAFK